jgi:hypothetical protein
MLRLSWKSLVVYPAALLLASAAASTARAQYYPPNPGYGGYGGYYPGRVGGALYGSAAVMDSYSNQMLSQERARILREQANQAKLDTKRKAFDERAYERANTPSWTQEQAKIQEQILNRILTNATGKEITDGKAQNTILPYLQGLANRGIMGPPVALDQNQLQQINVTGGNNDASVGMLKEVDHLEWPLVLRGPTQEKLAGQLIAATDAAAKNKLTLAQFREVSNGVNQIKDELKKQFYAEEIDGTMYLTGKRFLEKLEASVNQLQQPGASKFLSGTFAAKGRTVPELVQTMSNQGLRFAPANPGGEPAYFALYNAMVSYSAGAENASGFRVQSAPPPASSFKYYQK